MRRALVYAIVTAGSAALAWGCSEAGAPQPVGPSPQPRPGPGAGPATVLAAGDIAECGVEGASLTARLLDDLPGTILALGDTAYFQGTPDEYRRCYEPTWGRHKGRTRPIPGNHEYETPGAAGYYGYFGDAAAPAAPGFYSLSLGSWHLIALNSAIPVDQASLQMAWLRGELAAPSLCTLVFVHHPLFSSGPNAGHPHVRPIWDLLYAMNVDLVLSGDDHMYERFAPQTPGGQADLARGIRLFVLGTGGARLYPIGPGPGRANSEIRASVWGITRFTLRETGYDWEFIPVEGQTFRDRGSANCH